MVSREVKRPDPNTKGSPAVGHPAHHPVQGTQRLRGSHRWELLPEEELRLRGFTPKGEGREGKEGWREIFLNHQTHGEGGMKRTGTTNTPSNSKSYSTSHLLRTHL